MSTQTSYSKYVPTTYGLSNNAKVDKPKPKINFEFCPLDKESFSQNMGSISENTLEGTLLTQILPPTKDVSATKIPPSTFRHNFGAFQDQTKLKPKPKAKESKENAI